MNLMNHEIIYADDYLYPRTYIRMFKCVLLYYIGVARGLADPAMSESLLSWPPPLWNSTVWPDHFETGTTPLF